MLEAHGSYGAVVHHKPDLCGSALGGWVWAARRRAASNTRYTITAGTPAQNTSTPWTATPVGAQLTGDTQCGTLTFESSRRAHEVRERHIGQLPVAMIKPGTKNAALKRGVFVIEATFFRGLLRNRALEHPVDSSRSGRSTPVCAACAAASAWFASVLRSIGLGRGSASGRIGSSGSRGGVSSPYGQLFSAATSDDNEPT